MMRFIVLWQQNVMVLTHGFDIIWEIYNKDDDNEYF